MWVSIPLRDEEMVWLESATGPWKRSKDELFRRSGVELALVTDSVWRRWALPSPQAPILTVGPVREEALRGLFEQGAKMIRPIQETAWGAEVGFVRLPSGVLLEISAPSKVKDR